MLGTRHSDYGAEELKREYNRDLGNALAISIALHLALIFFLWVSIDPKAVEPVDTHLQDLSWMVDTSAVQTISLEAFGEMKMGGGGGGLKNKAPEEKSTKGLPEAEPDPAPKEVKKAKPDLIALRTPPKVHIVNHEPERPQAPSHKDTAKRNPAVIGPTGDHPLGTGERTAGGTGGAGVGFGSGSGAGPGYALNGFGNRGWLVRPTAKYPENAQSTGAVTLRFTAQPNGDITNIVPVKQADQALVQSAINGLKRAKARPLPDGLPQVPQNYVITYTFDLR